MLDIQSSLQEKWPVISLQEGTNLFLGLELLRYRSSSHAIIDAHFEPGRTEKKPVQNIITLEMNDGSLDVTLFQREDGVSEVLSMELGIKELGGRAIDNYVVQHLLKLWKRKTGIDFSRDALAVEKLTQEAEKLRRIPWISREKGREVSIEHKDTELWTTFSLSGYTELIKQFLEKSTDVVEKVCNITF